MRTRIIFSTDPKHRAAIEECAMLLGISYSEWIRLACDRQMAAQGYPCPDYHIMTQQEGAEKRWREAKRGEPK